MGAYREDTIAALATPPGVGAIAVVRVSGREAVAVAERVLSRLGGTDPPSLTRSHRAKLARLRDPSSGRLLDEVLVLPMLSPRSYTGEDTVEIHCHGGRLTPQLALRALLHAGARGARPGEFTERAFLNGRLDLCQAEAVAELIGASSELAAAIARDQLEGRLSGEIGRLRELILEARALAEAHLDFPEDDIPPQAAEELSNTIAAAEAAIAELAATYERGRLAREGARVVLIGKPNVGKSSLLNAVLGRDRALVSSEPGTTRDYLEEPTTVGGLSLLVCDTAGVRPAESAVEQAGIARTRDLVQTSDVVVVVLDGSSPLDDLDEGVLCIVREVARRRLVVRSKVDLPPLWNAVALLRSLGSWDPNPRILDVSACTGSGIAELCSALRKALLEGGPDPSIDRPVIAAERHHAALLRAAERLGSAQGLLGRAVDLEIVALELQSASLELEEILGIAAADDVLERIFSRFCIGK